MEIRINSQSLRREEDSVSVTSKRFNKSKRFFKDNVIICLLCMSEGGNRMSSSVERETPTGNGRSSSIKSIAERKTG